MKKFLHLLLYLCLSIPAGMTANDTIRDFELGNVKVPVYQKGKLAFIIFADNGNRRSLQLSGKNTLIDRLVENVDVDKIPDGWMAKIYPLDAQLPEVLKFWQKRYATSEAVIFTPRCTFDRKTNIVSSNNEVKMRTPSFDLDGIGFRSDLNKKELEINSDVQIIARRDDSDPREIIPGRQPMPEKYTLVSASADSLRMDMVNNELMLIGNVKVVDGSTTLTCDRLTIFLKSKDQQKASPAGKQDTGDSSAMLKGISRVLADGEVVFIRRPEGAASASRQVAKCEHLDYDLDSGLIILTDPDNAPELVQDNYVLTGERIELLRFSRKAFVKGKCRIVEHQNLNGISRPTRTIDSDQADFDGDANLNIFRGNVIVKDNDATIHCDRMDVFLKQNKPAQTIANNKESSGQEFSPVSGSQELDRIYCKGNVKIITAAKADTIPAKSGKNSAAQPQPTVITSVRCDLDYPADKLIFKEQVKVVHQGDTLTCDRLDLFLKDSQYRKAAADSNRSNGGVALGGRGSGGKTLTKAIASGNVYMKDNTSDLATELLTLIFKELPPGIQQKTGMFAAKDIQLIRVICDGKVVANSFPGAPNLNAKSKHRTLKAEHAMSDMEKNRSEFHKDVYVKEDNNELFCRDMFVYTGAAPKLPETAAQTAAPVDDPDADPFDIVIKENSAPSKISLSNGIELQRIVCKNDVVIINRDKNNKSIRAEGDTAVYTVKTADVVITAEPPRRPAIRRDGRIQYSDIIRGNLREESLQGEGNVQMLPDKSFETPKSNQ